MLNYHFCILCIYLHVRIYIYLIYIYLVQNWFSNLFPCTCLGSSQILPCQLANGDACPPVLCPNTIVQYSCTVPSSAAYTVWTIPQGYCIPSAPMILNQTAVPTCGVKLPSARCGPFTANCTTATCMTSTLSVIVTSALDGQIITCSYYTSPSQNSTVGNATIFVIREFLVLHVP